MRRPAGGGFLATAALGFVLAGCGPVQRHRVLNLLFDGVPPLEAPAEFRQAPPPAAQAQPATPAPPGLDHPPFAAGECDGCHEAGAGNRVAGAPELCWRCHDPAVAAGDRVHYPVEEGLCLDCHAPHRGVAPPLLRRMGAELCAECHDADDVTQVAPHRLTPADTACGVCHAGHSTGAVAMLRLDASGAVCFRCHPATGNLAPDRRQHGPAATGRCFACHVSHAVGGPQHLVAEGGELCLRCHEPFAATVPHDPVAENDCLACHDPHGSAAGPMLRIAVPTLCWECHDAELVAGPVRHPAASDDGCLQCHAIHGSAQPSLLFDAVPALCATCHPGEAHRDPGLAGQRACLKCHDPHSSSNPQLLR